MVTGNINGKVRTGGIADNMGGYIGNCVSDVTLSGASVAGISGYYTNNVDNCYSNYGDDISIDDGYVFEEKDLDNLNNYIAERNKTDYKGILNKWVLEEGVLSLTHK